MTGTILARAKGVLAMLAAGTAGYAIGVGTAINLAFPTGPLYEVPEWIPRAEFLGWVGVAGAGLCAVAWMYLDYRYGANA